MEESEKKTLLGLMADKLSRSVKLYLDNCSRCGVCIDACHAYASTGDVRYTAVARAQNIRRLFENYHKLTGKVAPWLNEAVELDERWMEKVYETAFTCTGCRRCMTYCPFGIDTQQIQAIAKAMLIGADMDPRPLTMRAKAEIEKGQKLEATKEKFAKEVEKIRAGMIETWPTTGGYDQIPMDVKNADVLFVSMAEKPSILPAARILNAARENWTLSCFEAVNFGAFLGSQSMTEQIYQRIVSEAEQLEIKELVICECGTAYRLMKHVIGKRSFNVITFMELIDRYIRDGRIKLDKSRIEGTVTYHDPCQIARNGGIYEEPRNCLKAVTDNFIEMTPNRQANWCCGGGGGLVIAAEPEFRMMTSRVKADQIKATSAEIVATACEMCFAQLKDLNDDYELGLRVSLVSELIAEALVEE